MELWKLLENYQAAVNYIHALPKFKRTNDLNNIKEALNQWEKSESTANFNAVEFNDISVKSK